MAKRRRPEKKSKKLVMGDDAIDTLESDWFDFGTTAAALAEQLYGISKSSGICCGIIGPWGSGKSSFMKLMKEHVCDVYQKNACSAWFTAWDPGGIEDLGDAMLYRLFHDVSKKNDDLSNAFKRLQEALGVRKGIREHARRAIGLVSKIVPDVGRPVTEIAGGLLELDTPRKVEESFDELVKWLEEKDQTIFFFIDDLDRAHGEQIRDLLSELKVYVGHRRIIAVLGYDEDYVLKALRPPVLPEGIDPKRYLEKIVTIRRNLPIPSYEEQILYAENLIEVALHTGTNASRQIAIVAMKLSHNNPRALKTLVLRLTNAILSMKEKNLSAQELCSFLIAIAAMDMGVLVYEDVREAIEMGEEDIIKSALKAIADKEPSRAKEIGALVSAIDYIEPEFQPNALADLRFFESGGGPEYPLKASGAEAKHEFNWKASLFPILSAAAKHGFELPQNAVEASARGIVLLPSTDLDETRIEDEAQGPFSALSLENMRGLSLTSKTCKVQVILTSDVPSPHRPPSLEIFIERIFAKCSILASDKSYSLWIIDDSDVLSEITVETLMKRAQESCKGLKHPFIFQYTPASKIQSLLAFLLDAASSKGKKTKK